MIPSNNRFYWTLGFAIGIVWGALIPDLDAPHSELSQRLISHNNLRILLSLFISIFLGLRFLNIYIGIITFLITYFFLLNIILNKFFVHRGIAHSLWGLLILNIILILPQKFSITLPISFQSVYNGNIIGINIGFISHILGDTLTFSGIRPFFPLNMKISLHLFRTNSFTEKILFYFFTFTNFALLIKYLTSGG
jgi:inner membrane protein